LQEVDWAQYDDWLLPRLSAHGYAASFLPKSRFRTMSEKMKKSPGGGVDGCATFWKKEKFRQVGSPLVVEFAQLALGRADFAKNDTMFERFCSKDNIALGVVLESTVTGASGSSTPRRCFVVNVHIHWDPAQTDVKLVQSVMLMDEIGKYSARFHREHGHHHGQGRQSLPTIICGDFNSLPNSLVYDFLSKPGGVRDVGRHSDLVECFAPPPSALVNSQTSSENPDAGAASPAIASADGKEREDKRNTNTPSAARPIASSEEDSRVQLKRWLSWKESGYGEIARADVLKHALSGSLRSAYKGIEGVAVEVWLLYVLLVCCSIFTIYGIMCNVQGMNLYVPPAHVLSSAASSDNKGPATYPIPALPFTNHTENFTGVIDYVWYTSDDFEVDGVLGGYLLDDSVGRDMVRWIREGQANEDPQLHYAGAKLASLADLHEHHPSVGLVAPQNTPIWNNSLLLVDAGSDAHARQPPQPKVWSVRGTKMLGFPNPVFPSDHIPVVVEFRFGASGANEKNGKSSGHSAGSGSAPGLAKGPNAVSTQRNR
jgi:mRNA deadenylase 3'-5' endonuclease subunit Ccr4